MNSLSNKSLLDGPHSDSSLGQPTGPTQMVNRMQNPAGMMLSLTCLVVTAEICVGHVITTIFVMLSPVQE